MRSSVTSWRTHGLEYLNTDLPTATAFPDGESAFLLRYSRGQQRGAR